MFVPNNTRNNHFQNGAIPTQTEFVNAFDSLKGPTTLADFKATSLGYAGTETGSGFRAGDRYRTQDGYDLRIAASGASDHDDITTGGVKFYVDAFSPALLEGRVNTVEDDILALQSGGADGRGIESITPTYQASASGTVTPVGTWLSSPPVVTKGQFLWTRFTITYTDDSTDIAYTASYHATDGTAGKGIASGAVTYQASASGTTAPSGTWVSSPPAVTQGQFLWTRMVLTYTDATTSTAYSTAYHAVDGAGGGGSGSYAATYDSLAALKADGTARTAGQYLGTRDGHVYKVLASGATVFSLTNVGGYHLTNTAGNVKLQVMPSLASQGYLAVAFGAIDDGTGTTIAEYNATTEALQMCVDVAYKTGWGNVILGRSHHVTTLNLRPGVSIVGGSSTNDVSSFATFGGYRTAGSVTTLIQPASTNAPLLNHPFTDYTGDAATDMARGFRIANIVGIGAGDDGAYSTTNHPIGLNLEGAVFIRLENVFMQNFLQAYVINECWDSEFHDLKSGKCDYAMTITNRGTVDNSNVLKFFHPRFESWNKNGLRILSKSGSGPRQNSKLDFFAMKNEGHPGSAGESCIEIDGNAEVRFWGGYSTMAAGAANVTIEAPSTFKMIRIHATAREVLDVAFFAHELDTNSYAGTIDSMVYVDPGSSNISSLELDFDFRPRTTPLTNGIIHFESGTYRGINVNYRHVEPPSRTDLHTGWSNVPLEQKTMQLPDRAFEGLFRVKAAAGDAGLMFLREDADHRWKMQAKADGAMSFYRATAAAPTTWIETLNFSDNGNILQTANTAYVTDALALRPRATAPSIPSGTFPIAIANGTGWNPSPGTPATNYPVYYNGTAWVRLVTA